LENELRRVVVNALAGSFGSAGTEQTLPRLPGSFGVGGAAQAAFDALVEYAIRLRSDGALLTTGFDGQ
jgi:hypothetical protein